MGKDIEIRFWYGVDYGGGNKEFFSRTFDLENIMNGMPFEEISDNPFYKNWSMLDVAEKHTGIKDKNGKPMFEGDIIRGNLFDDGLPTMGEVVFDDHFLFFASKNEGGNTPLFKINNIKVVGNIHDNPRLLGRDR